MKDYEALQKICLKEVIDAGIEPGQIVEWSVNRKAMKRWGECRRCGKYSYKINISYRLIEDDRVSEKACKETIIHEILHTVKDCSGHKGRWKECAAIMNRKYGYNIKRCTSPEEKGIIPTKESESGTEETTKEPQQPDIITVCSSYKYLLICRYCGYYLGFKRNCKTVRYYRNYTCSHCGRRRAYNKYS